ncbi:MAG: HAMP domain-containing sensor histidine kinase [Candidatus Kapabacteria bacterium]|nr:HAMP domain-containing sensor histidine kinase [Candidatus Kapabacteria bacterium]
MENINKYDYESIDWEFFFKAIDVFISKKSNFQSVNELILNGLKVFQEIHFLKFVAFFTFDYKNAEFFLKSIIPEEFSENAQKTFDGLSEQGSIGVAINKGSVIIANPDIFYNLDSINFISPIIFSSGVFGLVLISTNKTRLDISLIFQQFLTLYSSIFTSAIENSILISDLNKNSSLLEQKVAERTISLSQSKREINAILDATHCGIMVIDSDTGEIIKINHGCLEIIGDIESKILSSKYTEYLDYDLPQNSIKEYGSIKSRKFESNLKASNGNIIPIIRSTSYFNLGTARFRIENFNDIPEIKQAQQKLKRANEILELQVEERTEDYKILIHKLKQQISERERAEIEIRRLLQKEIDLNELKSRFISMVSHEFRTPLTIIRSSSQLISEYYKLLTEEEKLNYLQTITQTVDNMTDMMENVVFIEQASIENEIATPSWIRLKDFCLLLINDVKKYSSKSRIINFSYQGEIDYVYVDSTILRLILVNLLANSIKYSETKSIVNIDVIGTDKFATFVIKDSGIGIPNDEIEKIFDTFYRAKNVGEISGTGLGMTVVMRSLKLLNGTLDINSQLEVGTTFTVKIPINDQ